MEFFCLYLSSLSLVRNNCWLLPLLKTFPPLPPWYCSLPEFSSPGLSFSVFDIIPQQPFCRVLPSHSSDSTLSLHTFIPICDFCCYLHVTGSLISPSQHLPWVPEMPFCTGKPYRNLKLKLSICNPNWAYNLSLSPHYLALLYLSQFRFRIFSE